jgi:hypothetical protein
MVCNSRNSCKQIQRFPVHVYVFILTDNLFVPMRDNKKSDIITPGMQSDAAIIPLYCFFILNIFFHKKKSNEDFYSFKNKKTKTPLTVCVWYHLPHGGGGN